MTKLLNFLAKWHIILIIITLILIFALIGYFVNEHRRKASPFKIAKDKNNLEEITVDKLKSLDSSVSLSAALNKNAELKNKNGPTN